MMQDIFERLSLLIQCGDRIAFVNAMEEMIEGELRYDIDYQDSSSKNTCLHVACQNGNKLMVKNLLRNGANMNVVNARGNTALHFAYAYGYRGLGDYIISKGADDSIKNVDGLSCYEGLRQQDVDRL